MTDANLIWLAGLGFASYVIGRWIIGPRGPRKPRKW